MRFGHSILERAEILSRFTEQPGHITRTYLTLQHRQAGDAILAWMRDAGLTADYDALGNVVGRYVSDEPDAPLVLTGSHMDSVVDAGKFDGLFGILTAIACVKDLHDLHIWALSTEAVALTAHVLCPAGHPGDAWLARICDELHEKYGVDHATIQVETGDAVHQHDTARCGAQIVL